MWQLQTCIGMIDMLIVSLIFTESLITFRMVVQLDYHHYYFLKTILKDIETEDIYVAEPEYEPATEVIFPFVYEGCDKILIYVGKLTKF